MPTRVRFSEPIEVAIDFLIEKFSSGRLSEFVWLKWTTHLRPCTVAFPPPTPRR